MRDLKLSAEDEALFERDLVIYGNAVLHYAQFTDGIRVRRLDPLEAMPELAEMLAPAASAKDYDAAKDLGPSV